MKKLLLSLFAVAAFATLGFGQNDPTADTWQDNGGNVETNSRPIVSNTGGNSSFTVQRTDGTFFNMVAGTAAGVFFYGETKRFTISPGTNINDNSSDFPNSMSLYGGSHPSFPGQVIIGAQTPGDNSKLTVNGTVRAEEAKVVLDVEAPDYVFDPEYSLRSLNEVENYIIKNKHLPEIPSAAEFAENGVMLGQMSFDLLKKVEELTLYMIELKKENETLKERVERLESK